MEDDGLEIGIPDFDEKEIFDMDVSTVENLLDIVLNAVDHYNQDPNITATLKVNTFLFFS